MAVAKQAQVVRAKTVGAHTRLLELVATEPLGFVGGQYIIIDSGLVSANGKAVKRAYSLLSSDADQHRFQLAVQRIPNGPGSEFLHGLEAGMKISFSGPWGKLFLRERVPGATLILATDTGITAALGLIRSTEFTPLLAETSFIWLRTSSDYFLPDDFVRGWFPKTVGRSGLKPFQRLIDLNVFLMLKRFLVRCSCMAASLGCSSPVMAR